MTNVFGITARAFRFYEDGTENGSTAVAAENANITRYEGSTDLHLRYGVQESGSGSASGATTDDYQLQYSKNGGAYTNVTGSSSNVVGYDSSNLTDAASTTQRLSAGTGSFIAGEICESDGLLTDWQLTANNHSELLYAIRLVPADLANGDTLDFRVLRNGSVFNTYSVTPRITITTTQNVDPGGVTTGEAFGSASLALAIDASGISTGEAFGSANAVSMLDATSIASAETFGSPTIEVAAGGGSADHIVYGCAAVQFMTGFEGVTAGGTVTSETTDISIPGPDTSGNFRFIVIPCAGAIDATGTQASNNWQTDDTDVTSPGQLIERNTDVGVGGGVAVGYGYLDSGPGPTGTWTCAWNSATKQAYFGFACYGTSPPGVYSSTTGEGVNNVAVTAPDPDPGSGYYLIFVETANQQLDTPADWTLVGSFGTGTAGAAGSTRITVFAAPNGTAMPTLTIPEGSGQNVDPSGIASAEAFGTSVMASDVAPSGIASTEAFGTATAVSALAATAIASAEAFGADAVTMALGANGIASTETFGAMSLADALSVSGIASAEAFGAPAAIEILAASGIASLEAFGTGSLQGEIVASGIASTEAFGAPTMAGVAAPAGITSLEAFGSSQINQAIAAAGIASLEAFGSASFDGVTAIDPTGIGSAEAFGVPWMDHAIGASGVVSLESFGSLAVAAFVDPGGIASAESFGAPGAGFQLGTSGIATSEVFGGSRLDLVLVGIGISSAEMFGASSLEIPFEHPEYEDYEGDASVTSDASGASTEGSSSAAITVYRGGAEVGS